MEEAFAIVLAGGRNERLWPLARASHPKALLPVAGRSLLSRTLDRVRTVGIPPERTIVVGSHRHAHLLSPEAPGCSLALEPEARDTATAVALACLRALKLSADPLLCVFPSDHLVPNPGPVAAALRVAISAARRHRLFLTLGTVAREPSTAYGWLRPGPVLEGVPECRRLVEYVEKPDAERARRLYEAREHLWNCGTFVLPGQPLLLAFERFQPAILETARQFEAGQPAPGEAPRLSLDHAILEPATGAGMCAVVTLRYNRHDIGRLDGMDALWGRDARGNAITGDVLALGTSNCVLAAEEGTALAALETSDLVIIAEGDVVLVCPRERAAEVRELVAEMTARGRKDLL